jgi:PadR family transcriptional regulator PadR
LFLRASASIAGLPPWFQLSWLATPVFLLITYREIRYTHVGFQMEKDGPEKTDVLQGTLILLVLRTLDALGPLHGYGIARRIEQISRDLLQLNQGTLYPALLRMEQEGWITSRWGASEKNRKAKFYSISAAGRRQLAKETRDWQRMSSTINRFLGSVPDALAKDLL